MTQQTETKTTRTISKIMELIEEYRCCPDEISLLKVAREIYEICLQPVRDSQKDMADFGCLDALADRMEE